MPINLNKASKKSSSFSDMALEMLQGYFDISGYPNIHDRRRIALLLGDTENRIQNWFKSRRAKSHRAKATINRGNPLEFMTRCESLGYTFFSNRQSTYNNFQECSIGYNQLRPSYDTNSCMTVPTGNVSQVSAVHGSDSNFAGSVSQFNAMHRSDSNFAGSVSQFSAAHESDSNFAGSVSQFSAAHGSDSNFAGSVSQFNAMHGSDGNFAGSVSHFSATHGYDSNLAGGNVNQFSATHVTDSIFANGSISQYSVTHGDDSNITSGSARHFSEIHRNPSGRFEQMHQSNADIHQHHLSSFEVLNIQPGSAGFQNHHVVSNMESSLPHDDSDQQDNGQSSPKQQSDTSTGTVSPKATVPTTSTVPSTNTAVASTFDLRFATGLSADSDVRNFSSVSNQSAPNLFFPNHPYSVPSHYGYHDYQYNNDLWAPSYFNWIPPSFTAYANQQEYPMPLPSFNSAFGSTDYLLPHTHNLPANRMYINEDSSSTMSCHGSDILPGSRTDLYRPFTGIGTQNNPVTSNSAVLEQGVQGNTGSAPSIKSRLFSAEHLAGIAGQEKKEVPGTYVLPPKSEFSEKYNQSLLDPEDSGVDRSDGY